jgi:phage replication O-like protein O
MQHTQQVIKLNDHRPIVKANIEDGYDRLAHELTNALAMNCASLSGCEYQVLFGVITKTFRWQKKEDWVSHSQLSEITGMSEAHISKTVRSLRSKKVLLKNGKKTGINSVVSEWEINQSVGKVKTKKSTNQFTKINQSVHQINQSVEKNQPIRPPQKKETITKETIQKKSKFSPSEITLPSFLPKQLWLEFIQHRKDIKKPMSELACTKLISQLTKDHSKGLDVIDAMNESIVSGWSGVFPKSGKGNRAAPKPENFNTTDYGEIKGSF